MRFMAFARKKYPFLLYAIEKSLTLSCSARTTEPLVIISLTAFLINQVSAFRRNADPDRYRRH